MILLFIFFLKMRFDALQSLRSMLLAEAGNYDKMQKALRTLHVPFQVSIKDLRSQVREKGDVEQFYVSFHEYLIILISELSVFFFISKILCTVGGARSLHHGGLHVPAARASSRLCSSPSSTW